MNSQEGRDAASTGPTCHLGDHKRIEVTCLDCIDKLRAEVESRRCNNHKDAQPVASCLQCVLLQVGALQKQLRTAQEVINKHATDGIEGLHCVDCEAEPDEICDCPMLVPFWEAMKDYEERPLICSVCQGQIEDTVTAKKAAECPRCLGYSHNNCWAAHNLTYCKAMKPLCEKCNRPMGGSHCERCGRCYEFGRPHAHLCTEKRKDVMGHPIESDAEKLALWEAKVKDLATAIGAVLVDGHVSERGSRVLRTAVDRTPQESREFLK